MSRGVQALKVDNQLRVMLGRSSAEQVTWSGGSWLDFSGPFSPLILQFSDSKSQRNGKQKIPWLRL